MGERISHCFKNLGKGKFIGFEIKTAVVAHADLRYLQCGNSSAFV